MKHYILDLFSVFHVFSLTVSISSYFYFYHDIVPPFAFPDLNSILRDIPYVFHFPFWVFRVVGFAAILFLLPRYFFPHRVAGTGSLDWPGLRLAMREMILEILLQCWTGQSSQPCLRGAEASQFVLFKVLQVWAGAHSLYFSFSNTHSHVHTRTSSVYLQSSFFFWLAIILFIYFWLHQVYIATCGLPVVAVWGLLMVVASLAVALRL